MPISLTNTSNVSAGLVNTNGSCAAAPVFFTTTAVAGPGNIPACSIIGALATDVFNYIAPIVNENNLTQATMWNQLINYLKCIDGNSACVLTGPATCCPGQAPASISINMPGLLTVEGIKPSGINVVSTIQGDLSGAGRFSHGDFSNHIIQM